MGKVRMISVAAILAALGAVYASGGKDRAAVGAVEFTRAGYFKDEQRGRVLTYCMARDAGVKGVAAIAGQLPHTAGQLTVAAIYDCAQTPAPADGVTLFSENMGEAIEMISAAPFDTWGWRVWMNPQGVATVLQRQADNTLSEIDLTAVSP